MSAGISMAAEALRFLDPSEVLEGEPGRAFLNITTQGCGSGCSYCYVLDFRGPQVLLAHEEVDEALRMLISDPRFVSGPGGTVVSMCPDTEPFKTPESTERVLKALRVVAALGNPVQVSTKEKLSEDLADDLAALLPDPRQLVVFTSVTSLSRVELVEPFAATVAERFSNFPTLRSRGLHGTLYIKPFLPSLLSDVDELLDLIRVHEPASACIGILYKKFQRGVVTNQHPVHRRLASSGIDERFRQVVRRLTDELQIPVFHTSVCVNAHLLGQPATPQVWRLWPDLCRRCGACPEAT